MSIRASELNPTIAAQTWSSIFNIFHEYSDSSRGSIVSSAPRTTPPEQRRARIVAPRFTNSIAYSTWKSRPSGEKTVMARAYAPGAANTDIHSFLTAYPNLLLVSYGN